MLKFLKLIYGYVIILVRGENLERFLNLCKSRKVYMEKIRYREDGQLMAQMQAADFFRLRPLRNKTGVHIQIIQKRGMPFFFLRNKKRKAFFKKLTQKTAPEENSQRPLAGHPSIGFAQHVPGSEHAQDPLAGLAAEFSQVVPRGGGGDQR